MAYATLAAFTALTALGKYTSIIKSRARRSVCFICTTNLTVKVIERKKIGLVFACSRLT